MMNNVLGVIFAIITLVMLIECDNPKTDNEQIVDGPATVTIKDISDCKKQKIYSLALGAIDNLNSLRELEKYTTIEIEATCRKYLNTYYCSKSTMIYALLKDVKLTATRN